MTSGTLFWVIVTAISTSTFFIVAAIVSVRGFHDLLDLLRVTKPPHDDTEEHV